MSFFPNSTKMELDIAHLMNAGQKMPTRPPALINSLLTLLIPSILITKSLKLVFRLSREPYGGPGFLGGD